MRSSNPNVGAAAPSRLARSTRRVRHAPRSGDRGERDTACSGGGHRLAAVHCRPLLLSLCRDFCRSCTRLDPEQAGGSDLLEGAFDFDISSHP